MPTSEDETKEKAVAAKAKVDREVNINNTPGDAVLYGPVGHTHNAIDAPHRLLGDPPGLNLYHMTAVASPPPLLLPQARSGNIVALHLTGCTLRGTSTTKSTGCPKT
jgi:hypothetical protein